MRGPLSPIPDHWIYPQHWEPEATPYFCIGCEEPTWSLCPADYCQKCHKEVCEDE